MILDRGPATIFERREISAAGERPKYGYGWKMCSLYAELDFSTSPVRRTAERQEEQIDARIRIHQNRGIHPGDAVVLEACQTMPERAEIFEILRAFHGKDDESGRPITDLALKAVI